MLDIAAMSLFDDMDEATAALIIKLHIEDSEELDAALLGKGKGREGEQTAEQMALRFLKEDMERNAIVIKDRQMTKSIADACLTDGNIIQASRSEEQTIANDHREACRLGGVRPPAPADPWRVTAEEMDEELLAKLSAKYVAEPPENLDDEQDEVSREDVHGEAESSAWAAARTTPKGIYRRCVACQEQVRFFDTARVPCGHEYCRDCLHDLYKTAMTDESLFPPRCCRQPITSGGVRMFLKTKIIAEYEKKKIEFDTPNRTYCSNPTCSIFIPLEHIANETATCTDCGTQTCTMCQAAAHNGDCPSDTALRQVLELANENGWQRCYSCRRLVDLDHGCNHMTCKCGAQFCYVCGTRWKQCRCLQWNENRLLARANQVIARRPLRPDPPQVQLAAAVQRLRARHNCDHESWQYVPGRHQCEECYHTLPSYIFECRQCNIIACNRCRRNRL